MGFLLLWLLVTPGIGLTPTDNYNELVIFQGNTIRAIVSPYYLKPPILASIFSYPELTKIIKCESNWQNVCNQKYGCSAGQGLAQLIPKTVKYCEQKLGKIIDPFNEEQNLECALWLYENEGTNHWGCEDCNWGSFKCWNK